MGNTPSADPAPAQAAIPYDAHIDQILRSLHFQSVDEILARLVWVNGQSNNKSMLEHLASRIIAYAVASDQTLCLKYVELAKKIDFTVNDTREEISFKDIFVQRSTQKFRTMKEFGDTAFTLDEKLKTAMFFGNLFNVGIITSILMNYWVNSFHHQPEVQLTILRVIKEKVQTEFQRPLCDKHIELLMETLIEKKFVTQPERIKEK
jgi:hypothetical protein